jgi:hypothetical protein
MKIVRTIKNAVGNAGTNVLQKVHDKTGYILNTPKAERKAARKAKRKGVRQGLSQWRPFGWLGRRDLRKERQDELGVSNPIPES